MVTAEQLDAARDVALRCFRSHSAFLFNTFVGRHSEGRRRPIREIQEKLAGDLHLLARILLEAREKVTPEVIDVVLVASSDGPPPSAESTWHELAVASILRVLVDAECQAAIDWPMDGTCPAPLPFSNAADADRLKDMILRCSEDGITALVDEVYNPSRAEALGDVEAGINREWGATRKMLAPPKQAIPHKLLKGWHAICAALDMPHSQRNDVKSLNQRCEGPIKNRGKGTQPMVYHDVLLEWWNGLAVMQTEKANERLGRQLSAEEQYAWGRSGTAAPGVQGGVKRRRSDRT